MRLAPKILPLTWTIARKSYDAVARTSPTTLEGLLAKLVFIGDVKACTPDAFDDSVVLSTLAAAATQKVVLT